MRTVKIVADSSANLMELKTVAFDAAPLKIITAQREFVDDLNEPAANTLKNLIETNFPGVAAKIGRNLGLCSFYAEKGGLLVGFEKL